MNNNEQMKKLVEAAGNGDQQAVTELYMIAQPKAFYIARDMLKDEDEAQDIVQDAFVKAFSSLHTLGEPEKFQGWLDTIVINRCRDRLKKKKPVLFTEMQSEDEDDPTLQWEDTKEEFQPEANLDYQETRRLIREMIDSLPDAQRIAVTLFYLEEMSVKEIAAVMDCNENTVKSRLNLARKSIKLQVLDLEKKGTRLYCMPLIPFLYWLFRQEVMQTAISLSAVGAAGVGTGTAVGASVAGGAGAGATAASAETVGVSAGAATEAVGATGVTAAEAAGAATTGTAGAAASTATTGATAATAAAAATKAAGAGIAAKLLVAAAAVAVVSGGAITYAHFAGGNRAAEEAMVPEQAGAGETVQNAELPLNELESLLTGTVELSEEELVAVQAVYAMMETDDLETYTACIMENREVLYHLYEEKLHGGDWIFTGEKFEHTDTGTGVYLKSNNVIYVGTLEKGLPEGKGNLLRWKWKYELFYNEGELIPGKSVKVLAAYCYLGNWSQGKANGKGTTRGSYGLKNSNLDMEYYNLLSGMYDTETSISSSTYATTFLDDMMNGGVREQSDDVIFQYTVENGQAVVDGVNITLSEHNPEKSYEKHSINTSKTRRFSKTRKFRNQCRWGEDEGNLLWPEEPYIQDFIYIENIDYYDDSAGVPFDAFSQLTLDVRSYAVEQGYLTAEDITRSRQDGVAYIELMSEPKVTADYIEYSFNTFAYAMDESGDRDNDFTFRYYFADGSNDYTRTYGENLNRADRGGAEASRIDPVLLKVMNQYGTENLNVYVNLEQATDLGDAYEIQAMIEVPVTFDEDPEAGKKSGDVISVSISDVREHVVDFEYTDGGAMPWGFGSQFNADDGKWYAVEYNDYCLAKEVYNGPVRLRKDAQIEIYDPGNQKHDANGKLLYETISVEAIMGADRTEKANLWMMSELKIPDDEQREEIVYNSETRKMEYTGRIITDPGCLETPGNYQMDLNANGDIIKMKRSYFP